MLLNDNNSSKKDLSNASKTALGGMLTALSVIIMIPSAIDIFVYVLPIIAGAITMLCVIELGKKWAFCVYVASSIIDLLLVANKEAVVMYVLFFGYYPILKSFFEKKLPKWLEIVLKFAVFNAAMVVSYELLIHVFGIPFESLFDFGDTFPALSKYGILVLLAVGNIIFIGVDYIFTKYATWYILYMQKRFHKMFRFK